MKQSIQQHNLTNQSPLAPALGDLRLHEHSLEHFSHTESHISKSKFVQTPKGKEVAVTEGSPEDHRTAGVGSTQDLSRAP